MFYGCYTAWKTVVLSPVARWVEDEEEKLTTEERKALDEASDATAFIALPFTTHAVQPPPYSGRDPEWREFVKLSKNKALLQRIRDDLAFTVRKTVEASVPVTMKTGKPLKVRKYWLDIDYPYRPPVEYHRSGYATATCDLRSRNHANSVLAYFLQMTAWNGPLSQSSRPSSTPSTGCCGRLRSSTPPGHSPAQC